MKRTTGDDFITHYARSEPFRSLTSLPRESWTQTVGCLNELNSWGLSRFSDPEYLERRLEVEIKIRKEFISLGGKPELNQPLYFFFGRNSRFEEHSRNVGYAIFLKDLPALSISFTYGDSLLAFDDRYRAQSGDRYASQFCGRVFRLADVRDLLEASEGASVVGLPIECQLWIKPDRSIVHRIMDTPLSFGRKL